MIDYKNLTADMRRRMHEAVRMMNDEAPAFVAVAWEKMKDANFSAQGFVVKGTARPMWPPRKKETPATAGKRILHGTGILQSSVHFTPGKGLVRGWVDLGKVPYARVHNEGGTIIQDVRPFSRETRFGTQQVRGFSRKLTYPKRQYLGFSPDIFATAEKDIKTRLDRIFKR